MRKFDYSQMQSKVWENEILALVSAIHEYKGRQDLFFRQKPVELNRLIETAKRQSVESSNWIEGIVTTTSRFKQLMAGSVTPRNRDEDEIFGYRGVLGLIHENYGAVPITSNSILQLHRELLKYTSHTFAGQYKCVQNEIASIGADGTKQTIFQPLSPLETPDAIASICENYRLALGRETVDVLLLIPCFILDFLCIHPFSDGNGRMSRLLTLLLLSQSGYLVGQYVSLEKAIADTKDEYYAALAQSDRGWHKEMNDPKAFIRYMLSIILSCYKAFELRLNIEESKGRKSTSRDIVQKFSERRLGYFTKQEVLTECPCLGSSSVEAALKKLTEEKVIKKIGQGKNTRYVRNGEQQK